MLTWNTRGQEEWTGNRGGGDDSLHRITPSKYICITYFWDKEMKNQKLRGLIRTQSRSGNTMRWCILVESSRHNVYSKRMIVLSQNDSIFLLSKLFYFVVTTAHTRTHMQHIITWAFFDTHLAHFVLSRAFALTECDGVKSTILYQVRHTHCITHIPSTMTFLQSRMLNTS